MADNSSPTQVFAKVSPAAIYPVVCERDGTVLEQTTPFGFWVEKGTPLIQVGPLSPALRKVAEKTEALNRLKYQKQVDSLKIELETQSKKCQLMTELLNDGLVSLSKKELACNAFASKQRELQITHKAHAIDCLKQKAESGIGEVLTIQAPVSGVWVEPTDKEKLPKYPSGWPIEKKQKLGLLLVSTPLWLSVDLPTEWVNDWQQATRIEAHSQLFEAPVPVTLARPPEAIANNANQLRLFFSADVAIQPLPAEVVLMRVS